MGLAGLPPLGGLASGAAFGELLLGRVLARIPLESLGRSQRLAIDHAADLLRNLSILAALAALGWGLRDVLALPAVPLRRRFMLAGFAGTLAATAALALSLPRPGIRLAVVALAAASGHVLAVLSMATAAAWSAPRSVRAALGAWSAASLFGLLNLVLLLLAPKLPWHALWHPMRQAAHALAFAARHTSEVGFLTAPWLLGIVFVRGREQRGKRTAAAALSAICLAAGITWAAWRMGDRFPVLLYGASRLSLLAGIAPLLYGPLLGLTLGVAIRALLGPRPHLRQLGAGILLLLAAGHLPRTAAAGAWMGLGAVLLARAAMAWAASETLPPQRSNEPKAEPSRPSPSSMEAGDAA